MTFRVRPATTIAVILAISLAFQIIALVSVPVTDTIWLSESGGIKFGVFGMCTDSGCSSAGIGYSTDTIQDVDSFSLPSNARHSVSKLLVVHPIAAGFTFILFVFTIALHWHGPASSLKLLFFVLIWSIPCFLLTLLSFLVDLLLFVPHLNWAGWLILAATVLIAISSILICLLRRTASSRRSASKYNNVNSGAEYQLAPLKYGYGTVDGGSAYKFSTSSNQNDDDDDERALFLKNDVSTNYDNTRNYDDLDDVAQTEIYDTMRGNAQSATSNNTYRSNDILAPLETAYKGGYDSPLQAHMNDSVIMNQSSSTEPVTAPYPSGIPAVEFSELPSAQRAPYPQDDLFTTTSSTTRLTGPRPMPSSTSPPNITTQITTATPPAPSELQQRSTTYGGPGWTFQESDPVEPTAPPLVVNGSESQKDLLAPLSDVTREPTYRTRIAQTLNALQPEDTYSTDSLGESSEDLLGRHKDDEFSHGEEQEVVKSQHPLALQIADDSSSTYSSRIPSNNPTPTNTGFPRRQLSLLQRSRIPENASAGVAEGHFPSTFYSPSVDSPSEYSYDNYPLPDPNDRRSTPAPSFTNESLGSSNFTSVSQRGINPEYLKLHPEELQRQMFGRAKSIQDQNQKSTTADLLIASNPDFSVTGSPKKKKINRNF